jgi:hypothetical protein
VKLEGSLSSFPPRELIDMVAYSSVTGVLNIYGPATAGQIFFRSGAVYHAAFGQARGIDALAELLELQRGEFSFVSDLLAQEESLRGGVASLLAAAERLAARWRQVRAYVPSLDLVPHHALGRELALRRVSPAHHALFAAMAGTSSLRTIAAQVGWAEIDVAEVAALFCVDGLIELRRVPAEPARSHHDGGGFQREGLFDRLLGRTSDVQRPEPEPQERAGEDAILRLLRDSR